jgi:hypothetical protein
MSWLTDNEDLDWGWDEDGPDCNFANPGGNSALRAGVRDQPCPTCGEQNRLTAEDVGRGYQCDFCADAQERGY